MASSQTCTCCFLNRITSLRNISDGVSCGLKSKTATADVTTGLPHPDSCNDCKHFGKELNDKCNFYPKTAIETTFSPKSLFKTDSGNFSEESQKYMIPERLNSELSSNFYVADFRQNESISYYEGNQISSKILTEPKRLVDMIEFILGEQRKFIKALELPITYQGGCFMLGTDPVLVDPMIVNRHTERKKSKPNLNCKVKADQLVNRPVFDIDLTCASGDKVSNRMEDSEINYNIFIEAFSVDNKFDKKGVNAKNLKTNLNDEVSETPQQLIPKSSDNNLNKVSHTDKTTSEKLLFLTENKFHYSNSSIESNDDNRLEKPSSIYVTATNSPTDQNVQHTTRTLYSFPGSCFNMSNCTEDSSEYCLKEGR